MKLNDFSPRPRGTQASTGPKIGKSDVSPPASARADGDDFQTGSDSGLAPQDALRSLSQKATSPTSASLRSEDIEEKFHQLDTLARSFSGELGTKVVPGDEWQHNFRPGGEHEIQFRQSDLEDKPVDYALGKVLSEAAKARYSHWVMDPEMAQNEEFMSLYNAVETARTQTLLSDRFPGAPTFLDDVYENDVKQPLATYQQNLASKLLAESKGSLTPEQAQAAAVTAAPTLPRHIQFSNAILEDSLTGKIQSDIDPEIENLIRDNRSMIRDAYGLKRSVAHRDLNLLESRRQASDSAEVVKDKLWPLYEGLLKKDQQDLQDALQGKESSKGKGKKGSDKGKESGEGKQAQQNQKTGEGKQSKDGKPQSGKAGESKDGQQQAGEAGDSQSAEQAGSEQGQEKATQAQKEAGQDMQKAAEKLKDSQSPAARKAAESLEKAGEELEKSASSQTPQEKKEALKKAAEELRKSAEELSKENPQDKSGQPKSEQAKADQAKGGQKPQKAEEKVSKNLEQAAKSLDEAQQDPSKANEKMKQAAEDLAKAGEEMERQGRETGDKAKEEAGKQLKEAAEKLQSGQKPEGNKENQGKQKPQGNQQSQGNQSQGNQQPQDSQGTPGDSKAGDSANKELPKMSPEQAKKLAEQVSKELSKERNDSLETEQKDARREKGKKLQEARVRNRADQPSTSDSQKASNPDSDLAKLLEQKLELQKKFDDIHSDYDRYHSKVARMSDTLAGELGNFLNKNSKPEYARPHRKTGKKLDIKKAMRSQAKFERTGVYDSDVWLRRSNPEQRNFEFVFVLDQSGSMGEAGSEKWDNSVLGLIMSGEALEQLEIPFGVVGFSDGVTVHKDLTEDYEEKRESVFEKIQNFGGGDTYDNKGLETGLELLKKQGQPDAQKVIIVLSDGEGKSNAVRALLEGQAKDEGVHVIGLGIGPGTEFVSEVYSESLVVEDLELMPMELAEVIRQQIEGVDEY